MKYVFGLLIYLLFSCGTVSGVSFLVPESEFTLNLPEGCRVETNQGFSTLVFPEEKGSVVIEALAPESVLTAKKEIETLLEKKYGTLEYLPEQEWESENLTYSMRLGFARDKDFEFGSFIISRPLGKSLMVSFFSSSENAETTVETVVNLLGDFPVPDSEGGS